MTVLSLILVLAGLGPVAAQESDPRPPGWVDSPTAQSLAKAELAEAWVAAVGSERDGAGQQGLLASPSTALRLGAAARYRLLARAYDSTYGEFPAAPSVTVPSPGVGIASSGPPPYVPPASKVLSVGSEGQVKYNYCGPASAYNILEYKGYTKSKTSGATLTKEALADKKHMNTDIERLTSVWGNNYNYGINRWRSGKDTGFYVKSMLSGSTGKSKFSSAFLYNLNAKEPFAVSTGEAYGTGKHRYNEHKNPRSTGGRGHWITARGYSGWALGSASSMKGNFADPMWTEDPDVKKTFTYTSSIDTFYTRFVDGRGIVW